MRNLWGETGPPACRTGYRYSKSFHLYPEDVQQIPHDFSNRGTAIAGKWNGSHTVRVPMGTRCMSVVARFEIERTDCIGADGTVVGELPEFAKDRDLLIELYRWMMLTRTFDAKAVALQRTGRLGTFPSCLGQEAVGIGLAHAMHESDVLVPSYREHGAQLYRGVKMQEILLYWGGDERGSDFAGPRLDFPTCITVGSQPSQAAGVALAFKLRKEKRVAVTVCGDGATSKGDVYEAMNVAGAWELPMVFVVTNNQWAISVPRKRQSAAETLAQKAIGAGIAGMQVDGNDVVAVRQVVGDAIERARSGQGASVVEAVTYRLTDHTTVDDASRYRSDSEVAERWLEEPIVRMRRYLTQTHDWTKTDEARLVESCSSDAAKAVEEYLAAQPQPLSSILDYQFETMPEHLSAQRRELLSGEGA